MVKCGRCGLEIDDSFELCPNCGNDLKKIADDKAPVATAQENVCSQCGLKISDESEFCPNCGNKLNAVQVNACFECGSKIGENDLICSVCGSKINRPKTCSNCGAALDDDDEFCTECGRSVNSDKNDLAQVADENIKTIANEGSSILNRIILFFKQLFGGNS